MRTKKTNDFHFKTFSIVQQKNAMKVNTDSVILGAYTTHPNPKKALDIGTGTGLLALMLAHKYPNLNVDAIEIEKDSCEEARYNFEQSNWCNRLTPIYNSLQNFVPNGKYDLIITNPPYFINSSKNSNSVKTQARHTDNLSFENIILFATNNLSMQGTLSLILPKTESDIFEEKAISNGLFLSEQLNISPLPNKNINRVISVYSIQSSPEITTNNMLVYQELNKYSKQHHELTKEFYLEK
jgi:tRNA1Val (adenine37-N6)-methyltransferase